MKLHKLIDTVVRLRHFSQGELAEKAGMHEANLSKFLNGETDIRSSSLIRILKALGIHPEAMLETEIDRLVERRRSGSAGEALESLIREMDSVTARTFLNTLTKNVRNKKTPSIQNALSVVSDLRAELKTVRRRA